MNISSLNNILDLIDPIFFKIPKETQKKELELYQYVNQHHLHCEDAETWKKIHRYLTNESSLYYQRQELKKELKAKGISKYAKVPERRIFTNEEALSNRTSVDCLTPKMFNEHVKNFNRFINEIFHDVEFLKAVSSSYIKHILTPLHNNADLIFYITAWIENNAMYLPLGVHLLEAYKEDMSGKSAFAIKVLSLMNFVFLPEASSEEAVERMRAFLTEAGEAHWRSCEGMAQRPDKPTAVFISLKNGMGGHTSPHNAMRARLIEKGWDVHFVNHDTDLNQDCDRFKMLGITFKDGSEMTENLFFSRLAMHKKNKDVCRIIKAYCTYHFTVYSDLFSDDKGAEFITRKIIPLNPHLIITTCCYHWSWKLAYRIPTAKTLLVASDVFFMWEAYKVWQRQRSSAFPQKFKKVHFATMTDDIHLLESDIVSFLQKSGLPASCKTDLHLDEQITVIGSPINPAFKIPLLEEIPALRNKWQIPEGTVCICISRGKLGFDQDLELALESYRTDKPFEKEVIIHLVCGENQGFYQRLLAGEFSDLAPNLSIRAHPLLSPSDFAELRSISLIDDIKAGGGSTFEGWYMISQGIPSMLFLTPGEECEWEKANCQAMEKWGIGKVFLDTANKTTILRKIMAEGVPCVTNRFKDWRPAFDKLTTKLKEEVLS